MCPARAIRNGHQSVMNRHRISASRHVGEPSSKYGYQPELFDRDMERHQREGEALYLEFRAWLIEHKVDPETMRRMFVQMYEEFLNDVE